MAIETSDFPQADRLQQVGEVAIAVSKGNHTDDDIENYIGLESSGRQGRYYRLAAEILGLVTNEANNAELTPVGKEYSTLSNPFLVLLPAIIVRESFFETWNRLEY